MSVISDRLEYLRGELRAERISMSELHELQGLAEHIPPGDVELLEAAGVPEFPGDETEVTYEVTLLIPEDSMLPTEDDLQRVIFEGITPSLVGKSSVTVQRL